MKLNIPRKLLLAIGVFSFVPQAVAASCSGDLTITRTQDLATVRACPTYTGALTVQSISVQLPADEYWLTLKLDGVERITGDVAFKDISVSNGPVLFSAPDLKKVRDLSFSDISGLNIFEVPKLQSILDLSFYNIAFRGHHELGPAQCPELQQLNWIKAINTTLTKIGGWDRSLVIPNTESFAEEFPNYHPTVLFTAKNNPSLNEISLQGFSNATTGIIAEIVSNGKDLQVDFPNFEHSILWVKNVAQFSAPEMKTLSITQSLWQGYINVEKPTRGNPGFIDNLFTTLDLPNVESIGSAYDIANNSYLADLSLSALGSVNTLLIQNNPELKDLSLPQLVDIGGGLNVSGSFDSILLPELSDTSGDLDIQSTDGKFTCAQLNSRQKHTFFVKGKYSCSTDSTGLSTGAKAGIGVGVALAVIATVALCGYLWIRRRRGRAANPTVENIPSAHRMSWKELDSEPPKVEAGGTELHELEGKTSHFETASSVMELESPAIATPLSTTPRETQFTYPIEKG